MAGSLPAGGCVAAAVGFAMLPACGLLVAFDRNLITTGGSSAEGGWGGAGGRGGAAAGAQGGTGGDGGQAAASPDAGAGGSAGGANAGGVGGQAPVCGDGVWEIPEGCDDGNQDNSDSCLDGPDGTCVHAWCGDGFVWSSGGTEQCDGDGEGIAGETAACDADCTIASCGDGTINEMAGEACDDGDQDNADACPDDGGQGGTCEPASCGDGLLLREGTPEECDDGNDSDADSCSSGCVVLCPGATKRIATSHCYLVHATPASWQDARALCLVLGAGWDLVAISSSAERAFVDDEVDPSTDCWVGGNDLALEGSFVWSNGEPWSWSGWDYGEPNDSGNEDCVDLVQVMGNDNDKLNDLDCAFAQPSICELTPAGEM